MIAPALTGLTAEPETAPSSVRMRCVGVACDDLPRGRAWAQALADEGLQTQAQPIDDRAPMGAADAFVLHISARPAEQLPRLRSLRTQAPQMPLLVALRDMRDLDQVLALEMGADDAIDMSWAAAVVAARLRALWRRGAAAEPSPAQELRFGALELLLLPRQARLRGSLVPLTEGEFEVLWLLAGHAGASVSRREILRRVRGLDDHPMDRSIDSRVYRIRAKLGDGDGGAPRIRTVRNHGYAFSPTGW